MSTGQDPAELPVVFQYQQALDEFRRREREAFVRAEAGDVREAGEANPLLKRMSELISLLDLTTTLDSALSSEEILDAALLVVLGEMQAGRGALLVAQPDGRFRVRARRGLSEDAPLVVEVPALDPEHVVGGAGSPAGPVLAALGLEVLCPIARRGRVIAALGIGARLGGRAFGAEEAAFLRSVAACAATPIENGLIYQELREVNQRLSLKVFQLRNLFDISRELTSSFDEESIRGLATSTVMGQLLVTRAALYLRGPAGLALAHERGTRGEAPAGFDEEAAHGALEGGPVEVRSLPEGPFRSRLQAARFGLVVPLRVGRQAEGLLAVGERPGGAGFSEEERELAQTLARQTLAALESVRLHRVEVLKERQDREMQIAREIQQSLFPRSWPPVPGFDLAAVSEPCHQVGGDHYDFIPLPDGRLAVAIADVSGKGAPASILMASVHAWLRALAGTASPAALLVRLNRFLYESTAENRYVTLVYGELDPVRRRFVYANAGHIPPWNAGPRGLERLTTGGPVLGLLPGAAWTEAAVELAPGAVLAMVTDGVTEAATLAGEEFGDDRVAATLQRARGLPARGLLGTLVDAVRDFAGAAGCADDLTALVLKAL